MQALDAVNGRFGAGAVRFARAAASMKERSEAWQMASHRRSPRYTTEWTELFSVR